MSDSWHERDGTGYIDGGEVGLVGREISIVISGDDDRGRCACEWVSWTGSE